MAASRFLFVHGAWHGAWSFDLLRLELERRAVSCEAFDLPALGDDPMPPAEAGFEIGVERLLEQLARNGMRRNWTIVAHSFGGFYATEAALRASGRVRSLVYVGAFVPIAGDDWKKVEALAPPTKAMRACVSEDTEGKTFVLDGSKAKELLYHDVAPGIAAAALARLKPQPSVPVAEAKIDGSAEALKKIPRSAIFGQHDRVVASEDLQALATRAGVPFELVPAGHCPILSMPKRIADLLLGVKG